MTITYQIKVNNIKIDIIIDYITNKMINYIYQLLAQLSGHTILKIEQLNKSNKKYSLIIIHFIEKKDADFIYT